MFIMIYGIDVTTVITKQVKNLILKHTHKLGTKE